MRLIILVLSLVLGVVPLLGVGWIFANGMLTVWPPSATVDGLFMTLILLMLSFCFFLNAYWEARDQGMLKFLHQDPAPPAKTTAAASPAQTPAKSTTVKASS